MTNRSKGVVACLVTFMSYLSTWSQDATPLNIGDKVPDILISNLIYYSRDSVRVSDFKGKLLILDFWATWCGPCISAVPKLNYLQKKYGEKIQILPITSEDENIVKKFLSSMKKSKETIPFSVVGDKKIRKLFKHVYIPHYVWISGDGRVIAITNDEEVSEENIKRVTSGQNVQLKEKRDETLTIVNRTDYGETIFSPSLRVSSDKGSQLVSIPDSQLILNSAITNYTAGLPPGGHHDSALISMWNTSIYSLYKAALWQFKMEMLNANNTVVEVSDSALFAFIKNKVPRSETINSENQPKLIAGGNRYCYELKVPSCLIAMKFDIMLDDLNRYFGALLGIEGKIEKRTLPYLALTRIDSTKNLGTVGGSQIIEKNKFRLKIRNAGMNVFIGSLFLELQSLPQLVDETGYNGNIDLDINCQLSDLTSLNGELGKYGLRIMEKWGEFKIGVIRLKGGQTSVSSGLIVNQ